MRHGMQTRCQSHQVALARLHRAHCNLKYLPKPLGEYPRYDTPCSKDIAKDYEAAIETRALSEVSAEAKELRNSYPRKVGAIVYAMPASRCDCAYAIGMLTRCLNCPTPEMNRHADRCLAYMAQTSEHGITYDGSATETQLLGYSDSDWCVGHSTTGFAVCFAGAVIGYGSRRQHSIATSSTEAEIMAASHTALEILYFRGLLREMGEDVCTTFWKSELLHTCIIQELGGYFLKTQRI